VDTRPVNPFSFIPAGFNKSGKDSPLIQTGKNPVPVNNEPSPLQFKGLNPQAQPSAVVIKQVLQSLGLPHDALSRALLVFSAFFSITPEPALLSALRKELLSSGTSSPKTGKEKNALEAKVLAALASADKGVVLSEESANFYAAIPGNMDFQERRQPDRDKNFLDMMNKISGKNGQKWIVWPFNYKLEGIELNVLVRILIKEPLSIKEPSQEEGVIIIDIDGPKRNWRFILNRSGTGSVQTMTADIGVFPELNETDIAGLRKEMKRNGFTGIRVYNGRELLLSDFFGIQALPSVNKEV